ncbi:MAG: phosphotransferase [Aeromicrobium sp.]
MTGRDALGSIDVDDAALAAMLGVDGIVDSAASIVEYDLTTMTTGGRWWVEGTARLGQTDVAFRLFVKLVQSATRSPVMAEIPVEFHDSISSVLPWHIEPNAYRGNLSSLLPDGMRIPHSYAVADVDDDSCALWLEAVIHDESTWTLDRYREAARMLGRFAASRSVSTIDPGLTHPMGPTQARIYFENRLRGQFPAAYAEGGVWGHPAVAAHVDSTLRARLMSLIEVAPELLDEIESLPLLNAHGDAAPQNLLAVPDGFCVIDWGFWTRAAVGFDLSQLVYSEVDLDRADASAFRDIQQACLSGYGEGLAQEGTEIGEAALKRAHTIQLAMAHGISAIPLDRLDGDPELAGRSTRERVVVLRHLLDDLGL